MKTNRILFIILTLLATYTSKAQVYHTTDFIVDTELPVTSVKDQAQSGTCWSFGTLAFLESELIRQGKGEFDLSEMFVARYTYKRKVINHVRMFGHTFFTAGGQSHDVLTTLKENGIVPEDVYTGRVKGEPSHDHNDLDTAMTANVCTMINLKEKELLDKGIAGADSILDANLGKAISSFTYNKKTYTPTSFRDDVLKIDLEQYIEITSYTHHPFYKPFCLESRYNWAMDLYYNLPLNEFMEIVDSALTNGYSLAWDGDVSETGFRFYTGTAVLDKDMVVTQEIRQQAFDTHATTIDHVMQVVGIAHNKEGKKFYIIKNSWGDDNPYNGYMYMAADFFMLKTVALMVSKDAIPDHIVSKLNQAF